MKTERKSTNLSKSCKEACAPCQSSIITINLPELPKLTKWEKESKTNKTQTKRTKNGNRKTTTTYMITERIQKSRKEARAITLPEGRGRERIPNKLK